MVPPRLVRRLLLTPLLWVLMLALVVVLPIPLVVSAVLAPWLPGRHRASRLLAFAVVYAALEVVALVTCVGLWVAAGFGWRLRTRGVEDAHYRLLGWLLATLVRVAERVFRLRLVVHGPVPDPDAEEVDEERARQPVLVLSRHAGPGDSFLLVHQLLNAYRRRPRIIMKDTLQLDPALDVICNRLPNAFIRPRPGADREILERITALSGELDPDGALVLFPEGGNFTQRRRLRAIRKLDQLGLVREAHRARDLEHLLPPRPGGVVAAVRAAPTADVIFVAHTGLDELDSVEDIWNGIPMEQTVRARWWQVAAPTIPEGHEEVTEWLYDWWDRIDEWVDRERARGLPSPPPP